MYDPAPGACWDPRLSFIVDWADVFGILPV
jgi:hypothetical protein